MSPRRWRRHGGGGRGRGCWQRGKRLSRSFRRCEGSGRVSVKAQVDREADVSWRPGKEGGDVVDRSVTLSRKPTPPGRWRRSDSRVRRASSARCFGGEGPGPKPSGSVGSGVVRSVQVVGLSVESAASPEQDGSLVTRRGAEGQGRIGRYASAAMKGTGTEVVRGNRSRR